MFAIGAVIVTMDGKVVDEFSGRCKIVGNVDAWVEQNVLPALHDMQITHSGEKHLRDHFWSWLVKGQEASDYTVVQNGYPVEYSLMQKCQQDDLNERYWQHPFPVLDLTSMAIAQGKTINALKKAVETNQHLASGSAHNPVYDATVTALLATELFKTVVSD